MANIKSAKKRVLISRARQESNKAAKTEIKTALKKARAEGATADTIKATVVTLDKSASKGLIHKNKAARLKSQLARASK